MAELRFRVQADYEKVQRLRDEITKLKQEIKGVDAIQDPTSFNKLNSKLQQTSKELGNVTGKIAEASAAMETDFKQKIFAASQGVNDFTEKIIAQKGVVRDVAADVKRLGEAYRESVKLLLRRLLCVQRKRTCVGCQRLIEMQREIIVTTQMDFFRR